MGVKLQLVLGLLLVYLSSCQPSDSNSTSTSNTTATTTTLSPLHNERNPNLIEEPPKTDPEIKSTNKNTPTRNESASGETEKVEKKGQHEKGSRAINIERYVSPEFQNNVFTLPDSSDAEKYLEDSFPYKSSTSSGGLPDFPDFDLTTPRTAFFDNKFTEAIQKLEQEFEANRGDEHDEHEPDEDEIEHDHEYMHENDELENDPMDKMMESTEDLPKNITYKHTKITKNNTADKNFADNNFTIVHVRKIDISTNFNDTQIYTYDSDRDRNNSNATTPKTVDTTRKSVTLTKPPVNKNNSYILNNKIETETIKAINLPTEAPAKSSESEENVQIPRKTESGESENKENLHKPEIQPAVTEREGNAITKASYEKTERTSEETPETSASSNNIKKENNLPKKTQRKSAESAANNFTNSEENVVIKALFGKPERQGNFAREAPYEKSETSSSSTVGNAITKSSNINLPENSTESIITKSPNELTQRKLYETLPTTTETLTTKAPITGEESSQRKSFETLPTSSTENVITKVPTELATVKEVITEENPATGEITTTAKLKLVDVTTTDATETPLVTTYITTPITELGTNTENSPTKPETGHPTETVPITDATKLEVTFTSTIPTNTEVAISTDNAKREATTLTKELINTEVVTEISLVETKTSITVETTEMPSTESTFTEPVTTSTVQIESTTEIPSTTEVLTTTTEPQITVTASVTELQGGFKTSTNSETITTENLSKESIFPETTTFEGTTEVVEKRLNEDTTEIAKVTEITTESTTLREETQTTWTTSSETQPNWIPTSKKRNGDATEEPTTRITTDEGDDVTQTSSATENVIGDVSGGEGKGKVAAIVISTVGALCLVLLSGLLYIMRKRQKRFNYMQNCRPVSLDDYSVDNLSAYNSVRRKGIIRASKRSYGNPAFDDPNALSHPLNFPALAKFSTNVEDMKAEFDDIPQISATASELPEGCESKNRYANVIPLPETRVFLSTLDGSPNSDYINANYVTGPKDSKGYYIACQSPKENTVDDFWRMIWEQNSKVILMITRLFENGMEKCTDYLPPSEVLDRHRLFGDFQVTMKKRDVKEKYIISSLQLKNMVSNSWREVTHFWYLGWPDKGIPAEANSLIAFLIEARSYMKSSTLDRNFSSTNDLSSLPSVDLSPVVVHCSPGTGRTGVVIACDIAIREFEQTRLVDVPRVVYRIRRDRAGAVQTKEQYMFIYKVVSLYAAKLTGGALDSF